MLLKYKMHVFSYEENIQTCTNKVEIAYYLSVGISTYIALQHIIAVSLVFVSINVLQIYLVYSVK